MTVEPGRNLSHYQLVEKIGEGGMGEVWRANDTTLDRQVAIKILPETLAQDADRLSRFEREAKVLASLNHPGIATIHGIEQSDGLRFLVLELVEGEDLAERLKRGQPEIKEALALAMQLAESLEVAHEQGVIHRDLKPANIKITPDGKVKVLDFGLAKALDPAVSQSGDPALSPTLTSAGTMAGMILGTASYMSPEQAKGKPVDRRADIWAFGVVLHEMLSGRRLFSGESISETIAAVLMGEPDIDALPANTPPRVRRLLERCLRKDQQSRLRDIGDARLVIEEALAGHEWKTTTTAEAGAPPRRAPWVLPALVLGGIAVGVVVGRFLLPADSSATAGTTRVSIVTEMTTEPTPVISPDGKFLVYPGDDGGLYGRSIDSYDETLIRGTEEVPGIAAFSPDGRWIAFVRGATLLKVPIDGSSPPVELGDFPQNSAGLAWMPGGDIVTITAEPFTVVRIPSGGGAARPPVEIRADEVGQNFFFIMGSLADGRHALAAADTYGATGWQMNIVLLDTESGDATMLVEDGVFATVVPSGHLLFTRKGTLLAVPFDEEQMEIRGGPVAILDGMWIPQPTLSAWFGLANNGTLIYRDAGGEYNERLAVVDRQGNLEVWSEDRQDFGRHLAVSRDGRRVAAHVTNWDEGLEEIWVSEIDRPRLRPLVDEAGLDCYGTVWSPDADFLYYNCAGPEKAGGVYRRPVDGSAEPELLFERPAPDAMIFPGDISPDGRWLLINEARGTNQQIRLLPVEADEDGTRTPRTLFSEGIEFFWGARYSPDGRWLAYQQNRTERPDVYIRSIDGEGRLGPETLVSAHGGVRPRWAATAPRASGEFELLYESADEPKTLGVTVVTTPSLNLSEPREIVDWSELRMQLLEPMPDGRFLIAQQEEQVESQFGRINVVFNWFEELERRAVH